MESENRFRIDHIGYITGDITKSAKLFEKLGYKLVGEPIADETQKTRICYLQKKNEVMVELVEPFATNEPMQKMLKVRGVTPYHICYEVDDIYQIVEEFNKEGWVPMFQPVNAPASGNRLISYMFKRGVGYIEFVNKD